MKLHPALDNPLAVLVWRTNVSPSPGGEDFDAPPGRRWQPRTSSWRARRRCSSPM